MSLRYVLPLAQMILAVGLLWQSQRWLKAGPPMRGIPPHFTILVAVNAPITFLRALWFMHVSYYWDMGILVVMIGLLWYWVALNVIAWRTHRAVHMLSWTPLRLGCDAILIVLGLLFGLVCIWDTVAPRIGLYGPYGLRSLFDVDWWQPSLFVAVTVLLLAWCAGLTYFFGRDFVHCLRVKTRVN